MKWTLTAVTAAALLAAWAVTGLAWMGIHRPASRWRLWPLLIVPVMLTASWWASSGDLVGRATFAHYRADLERLADRPPQYPELGPYKFHSVSRAHGCVLYNLRGPGMASASGFAWCPGTTPAAVHWDEGEVFEPIEGDWYAFLVRHGLYQDRAIGADPWGLQVTELSSVPEA